MTTTRETILAACQRHYNAHRDDCSAYVRAVSADLGYPLSGNADAIVTHLSSNWTRLTREEAIAAVERGQFVIVGLRSGDHDPPRNNGHVAVVVHGPLYHDKYPPVWGGSIGSAQSRGNKTVGEIWRRTDRNDVLYFTPRAAQ
jgi:hypothetical protein